MQDCVSRDVLVGNGEAYSAAVGYLTKAMYYSYGQRTSRRRPMTDDIIWWPYDYRERDLCECHSRGAQIHEWKSMLSP